MNEQLNYAVNLLLVGGKINEANQKSYIIQSGYIKCQVELSEYYSLADLMVYTTFNDTFGLTVAEALFCETRVIASDIGGLSEILPSKFLFDNRITISELAKKIVYTLSIQKDYEEWGSIFTSSKSKFGLDRFYSSYHDLYNSMCNEI